MEQSGHDICLFSRKKMELTGIEEVESFTDEQVTVSSSLGMIAVEGKELKIESFNTENGNLKLNGAEIDSIYYYGKKNSIEKRGFLSRLIK